MWGQLASAQGLARLNTHSFPFCPALRPLLAALDALCASYELLGIAGWVEES